MNSLKFFCPLFIIVLCHNSFGSAQFGFDPGFGGGYGAGGYGSGGYGGFNTGYNPMGGYGQSISKFALVNRCTGADREQMFRCEEYSRNNWNVRDVDFYTRTRKFCCFIWDTLSCQLSIAQRCDPQYATELSRITEQSYSSMCEYHSRRSASCALRWWSIALIVICGLAVVIAIAIGVFYLIRSQRESAPVSSTEYHSVATKA